MFSISSKNRTNLFFIAYSLILAYSFVGLTTPLGELFKMLTNISSVLLILLFITSINRFTYKELAGIILIMVLFMAIGLRTQNYSFLKLGLFALAFKDVNLKKCIQYDIWVRVFLILLIYSLYSANFLPDIVSTRGGVVCRHSYGFSNPNALALAVTILCMEIIYIYSKRHFKFIMICVAIIMKIVTDVTDSRTCLYSVCLYILLIIINRHIPRLTHSRIFIRAIQITPIVLTLLTMTMVYMYLSAPSSAMSLIYDKLLSGRLSIAADFAAVISPTLLGNDLSAVSERTLDNMYASLVLSCGIVITLLFFVSYWIIIKNMYKHNEMNFIFILFSFCIMGIGEKLWFAIDYNILMIVFGVLLYRGNMNQYLGLINTRPSKR